MSIRRTICLAGLYLVALAPLACGSELAHRPAGGAAPRSGAPRGAPPARVDPGPDDGSAPGPAHPPRRADILTRHKTKHPKLAYAWAVREVLGLLQECRESEGAGRVRVKPSVIFALDHEPIVESVDFEQADNVTTAEQECLRQTFLAMPIPKPDAIGPAWEGQPYTPTGELAFDASGSLTERPINRGPVAWVPSQTKLGDDLKAAVAACEANAGADATVVVRVTYDAQSGALVRTRAVGTHANTDVGRCAEAAVRDLARPTNTFEPLRPEDASIDCTFQLGVPGVFECARLGPDGTYLPAP